MIYFPVLNLSATEMWPVRTDSTVGKLDTPESNNAATHSHCIPESPIKIGSLRKMAEYR